MPFGADALPSVEGLVAISGSAFMWGLMCVFFLANAIWIGEFIMQVIRDQKQLDTPYTADDVQIRVLTIDNASVVQQTIDAVPDEVRDVHVITEESMDISGATVHVVPDSFSCDAIKKGRALEWARIHLPCEKEYVLFIDEDSVISEIPPLPDADVIQFSESPTRSGSLFTYLAEIFRMGFQIEQRAFPVFSTPLYAWGGGIAIKKELEDQVTWNDHTIIEDTVFVWKAAQQKSLKFVTLPTKFFNQAPPTMWALVQQRRRWVAGAVTDRHLLSPFYRAVFLLRTVAWSCAPVTPFLILASTSQHLIYAEFYLLLSLLITIFLYVWSVLGLLYLNESMKFGVAMLFLTPFISFLHSTGALWGALSPIHEFNSTEKVSPEKTEVSLKLQPSGERND